MVSLVLHGNDQPKVKLLQTLDRWQVLNLSTGKTCAPDAKFPIVLTILAGGAPNLQRLDMKDFLASKSLEGVEAALWRLPQLKHYQFPSCISLSHEISPYQLVQSLVRSRYTIDSGTLSDCIESMASFPFREYLDYELVGDGSDCTYEVISQVQRLEITGEINCILALFSNAKFPAVRKAKLEIKENFEWDSFESNRNATVASIKKFLEYSSPTLTELHVAADMPCLCDLDIINALEGASNLGHLVIKVQNITELGLRRLQWSSSENFCPELNVLTIQASEPHRVSEYSSLLDDSEEFSMEQLLETVRSRLQRQESMNIELQIGCYTKDLARLDSDKELKELQKQGRFQLYVFDYGSDMNSDDSGDPYAIRCAHDYENASESDFDGAEL